MPRRSVSTLVAPEKAEEYSDDEAADLTPQVTVGNGR